jgi:Family of unknown function (DUF5722)
VQVIRLKHLARENVDSSHEMINSGIIESYWNDVIVKRAWPGALFALLFLLLAVQSPSAAEVIPLRLSERGSHDITFKSTGPESYELTTTGSDPFVHTKHLTQPLSPRSNMVLSFEYQATTPTDDLQLFLVPPGDEQHSFHAKGLAATQSWTPYSLDLEEVLPQATRDVTAFRLDFGNKPGRVIQIRSLQLRPPNESELAEKRERRLHHEKDQQIDDRLQDYLTRKFSSEITKVTVKNQQITVDGKLERNAKGLFLVEIPLSAQVSELKEFSYVQPLPTGSRHFSMIVERFRKQDDHQWDRLLSRWAIAEKVGEHFELHSHAHCADEVTALWKTTEEKPRNKKGIGGLWWNRPISDLDDLNISSATVNVFLNSFMRTSSGEGCIPFEFGGRTWYADSHYIEHLDRTLLEASKRHIIVSAIILLNSAGTGWGHLAAHPDASPAGYYAMPNVSSEEGLLAYAAALDFLAHRYCDPAGTHGRIHHWIMHNEINAGWEWTNAGEKTTLQYLELYYKSMRTADLIVHQYDPHSRVYISLAQFWATAPAKHYYAGKELLEDLLLFSHAEGDFNWGIAFHPYPANLFNPRTWEDKDVTDAFNSPKITPRNLEVLDRWVRQKQTLYLGKYRRSVHLTEQGFNSPDYSEKSLADQAAGMAYTWKKVEKLKSIEAFDYHNWVDNRHEGGLRIGLRKFDDDKDDPAGRKPIWFTYQSLGTTTTPASRKSR